MFVSKNVEIDVISIIEDVMMEIGQIVMDATNNVMLNLDGLVMVAHLLVIVCVLRYVVMDLILSGIHVMMGI